MTNNSLTQSYLKSLLDYNPDTGNVVWRRDVSNTTKAGTEAGGHGANPYRRISIKGKRYYMHRIVWIMQYGCEPTGDIDHINGIKTDNRISNLRDVSHAINQQNVRRARVDNKSTKLLGAHYNKLNKSYCAHITVKGNPKHIGVYNTAMEAHEAYLSVKRQIHEGCTI